ncbi:MAG TPA: hypothetical protein ENI92_09330 [Bacteroidetes bacterium]|nr:hypothetical protein [Bacteroidota bacterium]
MEPYDIQVTMSAEDRMRLKALAEALRMSEEEVIRHLINKDYKAHEEGWILGEEEGEDLSV